MASGNSTSPVFFWHPTEEPYGFLCQWYPCTFTDRDVHPTHTFTCTEQYMMYHKALILAQEEEIDDGEDQTASTSTSTDNAKKSNTSKSKAKSKLKPRARPRASAVEDRASLPQMVLSERKPAKQKSLCRGVPFTPAQAAEWERVKVEVAVQGNYAKFAQNAELGEKLLGTGDRLLAEASPHDRVWGIGFGAEEAEGKRKMWGENLLGKALGRVRERLREEVWTGCVI